MKESFTLARLPLGLASLCAARVLAPPPTSPSTSFFHVADPWRVLLAPILLQWDLSGDGDPSGATRERLNRGFHSSRSGSHTFSANPSIDPC
ncbi:hypothetical protein BO83DRAFT_207897 [Aspergillus eucalypticola CBS 122712]|uniref:Secreted protein n=1 Tax=Aspergillus eucalypticola (strain CBS 122712 / IBT 29274) TaxID=1448314 RepID=A0A317UIF6_ASPEC|nr:uncharacterized protein BO83DRAFT_207897 [Aspergillus eucalypticola CBS 122712]PWY61874.1 hypothetical protein BO83DRAFT_207897 [Aspergillus eucalypticola CBS 122712]